MKRLTLTLLLVAALAPSSAQAHGTPDCYKNGKEIPRDQCALRTMDAYAGWAYYMPFRQSFVAKRTQFGQFHARYRAHVPTDDGLLVVRTIRLSARRCTGHFVVFDHRKQTWWPHGC